MRSLTVQILQPCHERWAEMHPNEQGRFCASCQKTVIDYTALSDQELIKLLKKTSETNCGRFRNEQLDRPLIPSNSGIGPIWRHWVGLLTMSLFSWQTARGQLSPINNPPSQSTSERPDFTVTALPARSIGGPDTKFTIDGRVMLMDSSGHLSPVSQAYVMINQPGQRWQTQTDSAGIFRLLVPAQTQATEFTVRVYSPSHIPKNTTFKATASTVSVILNDIILQEHVPLKSITGGGITVIHTPSRWQKLKRKLFR